MIDIPLGLRNSLESGDCVLFIGSGVGKHLLNPDGKGAPTGKELAIEIGKAFSIAGEYDLPTVAEYVDITKGRPDLEEYLRKKLSKLEPDEHFRWLSTVRWKSIYTTNYDNGIIRAYEQNPAIVQRPVVISHTSEIVAYDSRIEVPVYYIHGAFFSSMKPSIVISTRDYAKFRERRRMIFETLKKDILTSTFLYIGYSHQDINWRMLLEEVRSEIYPSKLPPSFRVDPYTDAINSQILKADGIDTLSCEFEEFTISAKSLLAEAVVDSGRLAQIKKYVPSDLIEPFEKNPAATTRLLNSWQYVNQAPFNGKSNLDDYLRGDKPNWALISKNEFFERDIEPIVYDSILEYATDINAKLKVSTILAPAGYGVTTLLMSFASKIVRDGAGVVFFLKPGQTVLDGDVEYALSILNKKIFFIVDNAADHTHLLHSITQRLREAKKSAMFILGERLNEWRQSRGLSDKEYIIEPITDPEIYKLIEYLVTNYPSSQFHDLPKDHQFSAIKKKYSQELLVTMREVTEGRSFDAIIEDEYRGLSDPLAKNLYLITSCFYQHGAYLRDGLLADVLDVPLSDLYKRVAPSIEGVVVFDPINEALGEYAARVRHRVIASIVWHRCGEVAIKEDIIQKTLSKLNLNFKLDKDAFEQLVKSDELVNSIRTLEKKIKFFETACQKDPNSPYVRQHFARMLQRENHEDTALLQINEGIKLNPNLRILYHTKALILAQQALNAPSIELGRHKLVQSEEMYRRALGMYNKDEYCYQGLAELFLDWSRKVLSESEEESAEYIARAEEVLTEGLNKVWVKDGLWIVSSRIAKYIGDEGRQLSALEKAVHDHKESIVGRYLLGRVYRERGNPEKSLQILEPVIKNHHDEFRSYVEYALAMHDLGKPYSEIIAILKLSNLKGYGDPRYLSILGGLLFLDGQLTEAEKVFQESKKRDFSFYEMNTIQFRPKNPADLNKYLIVQGQVAAVKFGYSLIDSDVYRRILCPGSKYSGLQMTHGLKVKFELAFCAKGPVSDSISKV